MTQQHTAIYLLKKHSITIAIYLLHLVVLWSPSWSLAQTESPFIRNYSDKEYRASGSNFGVIQDDNGILYFANFDGVLVYDGNTWGLIEIANGKTAYSLAIQDNKVYVGSLNEMGVIIWDDKGIPSYQSYTKDSDDINFGIVFKIVPNGNKVYFNSLKMLLEYSLDKKSDKLRFWKNSSRYLPYEGPFVINNQFFIHQENNGLYTVIGDSLTLIDKSQILEKESNTITLVKDDSTYLIGASSGDLYKNFTHFKKSAFFSDASKQIIQKSAISSATNYNNTLISSTVRNGILGFQEGILSLQLNDTNGLATNNVRSIIVDDNSNLWAATNNGITRINNITIWSNWNIKHGIEGTIRDIIKFDKNIYLSTSKGIYKKVGNTFMKIDSPNQRFFSFLQIEKTLYVNVEDGMFNTENSTLVFPINLPIYSVRIDSTKFITHLVTEGIKELKYNYFQKSFELTKIIDVSVKGFISNGLVDNDNYWFGIKNSGLFQYNLTKESKVIKFTEENGLPDVVQPFSYNHQGKLLFATGNGFYQLNASPNSDSSDVFIEDNSLIKERIGISHPTVDSRGNIWYVATYGKFDSYIEKLTLQDDGTYVKDTRPFKRLPQQEFLKIYPDPEQEGMIWIAGSEGLYRYNDNIEVDYDLPFNTLVRKVHTRDSLIFAGTYSDSSDTSMVPSMVLDQPEAFKPALIYANNQISFDFTATSYEVPEKNLYSYRLKGNEKKWSAWSLETKKEYTNLRPGTYTFLVKSKNIYDTIGRTASYEFTILPPWWMTYWAYAFYIIIGVFIFWVTTLVYTHRIRIQRRKLKLIVADRTYEVLTQSKEIEKKNSLLIAQTEEITQQRDDISEKNQELESSQEEIMAINSRLKELNDHLEMQVDMRTKKIKSTLVQLRKTNKELDTFIYRASHDLKGPISRIMGLSTLAKLEMPDTMNREYFNLIELAANDMKKLLSKLTQVHEMLNKKVVIKEIDVPSLLSSVRESLKHLDRDNDTKYTFNIKDQLSFESDEDIVRVIIENLVENAIIFRKEISKEVHHITIQLFEKDGMIHIVVRDNGQGIASELHDKLYDMFFRGSDNSKGTGLGLYLVKMAVDNLEGSITIDSEPNEFTEFTIQLPI